MWNSKVVSPKVCFPVVVPSYFVSFVQRFLHIVSLAPLIRKWETIQTIKFLVFVRDP